MSRYFTLVFTLLFITSCTGSSSQNIPINPKTDSVFTSKQYISEVNLTDFNAKGKTYYFIKVWGFLKYNADFESIEIDWDDYFISNINKIPNMDNNEYINFIDNTISIFPKLEIKANKNDIKDYSLIDNNWFNSSYFNKTISEKLNHIFENRNNKNSKFINNSRIGNLKFNNEKKYSENEFPQQSIRLLGLARYWNIINYFFVYKNDLEENWDKVLLEFIPKFANSSDVSEYHLVVQELSSKLYDCHSMVRSDILDEKVFGRFTPNFRIEYIDTTFIISKIRTEKYDDKQLKVGDIILKMNNEPLKERYDELNKVFKGANPPSERRIINPYLLSNTDNQMSLVILRDGVQKNIDIELQDYSNYREEESKTESTLKKSVLVNKMSEDIYYLDVNHLTKSNLNINIEEVKDVPNLILDLRSGIYDNIMINLANFLLPKESDFFNSTYSDVNCPGLLRSKKGYRLGQNNESHFKGNLYVLVDENTQSASEFFTMALQSSSNTKVVGSQTAGSDGNITMFHFPGKIETIFTGIGIYYPDMKPTQRVGIKIDHHIKKSVKGIQENKDEVLEKCIEIIGI